MADHHPEAAGRKGKELGEGAQNDHIVPLQRALQEAVGIKIVILPLAVIIAEVICLVMNYSMLSEMTRKVDVEMKSTK